MIRVPAQPFPRQNLLTEILSWPEPPPRRCATSHLAISPDGKQLAIASGFLPIRLVEVATGKVTAQFSLKDQSLEVLRFTNEGKLLAIAKSWNDGVQKLSVQDVPAGKCIREFTVHKRPSEPRPANAPVTSPIGVGPIAFSPDARKLLAVGPDTQTALVWDVSTDDPAKPLMARQRPHTSFAFSPDGKRLVSGGGSSEPIRLWEAATGKKLCEFVGLQNAPCEFAFTPDGQAVASGLADNAIHLWHVPSGKEIRRFQGHRECTHNLAISPNGKLLASGSEDASVRLWEIITGNEIRV
jgi:WD40 repeat protein